MDLVTEGRGKIKNIVCKFLDQLVLILKSVQEGYAAENSPAFDEQIASEMHRSVPVAYNDYYKNRSFLHCVWGHMLHVFVSEPTPGPRAR